MVWTTIPDSDVDQDSPVTVALMTALRDNVEGFGQQQDGAPAALHQWVPFDRVTVGDGNTGLIYDAAVDGAVSVVETPDLDPGFEHIAHIHDLTVSVTNTQLQLSMRNQSTGSYLANRSVMGSGGSGIRTFAGRVYFPDSGLVRRLHVFRPEMARENDSNPFEGTSNTVTAYNFGTPAYSDRFRFLPNTGNFTAGKIYLYRRALGDIT